MTARRMKRRQEIIQIRNQNGLPNNSVVLQDARSREWLYFQQPIAVLTADSVEQVMPVLEQVQRQVEKQGWYAAGFLSYEAAPAFDPSLRVQPDGSFPLAWFGLYQAPQPLELPDCQEALGLEWQPSISQAAYQRAIAQIKQYIAAGLTYQVNYSFRLRSQFASDPWPYFCQLARAQESLYGAFINLPDWAICCASPELFFDWTGSTLTSRPMKGTAPRGLTDQLDRQLAQELQQSEKNRAENLMIVDMIRNDMGRIAQTGSVRVEELFAVEQYPTLWQMTSLVESQTRARLPEIMQALFPCASITGAPKSRTMEIIAELENSPRRIYTGTIGFLDPRGRAQFNVAIRTVLVDKQQQTATYGVGGGIVWDSIDHDEYAECCTKARVLTHQPPQFSLLESILWQPGTDYFLLDLHLQRLQASARYFSFPLDLAAVQLQLKALSQTLKPTPHKVRLLVDRQGQLHLEAAPLEISPTLEPIPVGLAPTAIDSQNVFLYHKTSQRQIYDQARQAQPEMADVLLWNERGELTESCLANLVVELEGQWYTPPVSCGLLNGTYRTWLLQQGKVQERILLLEDLPRCSRVFLVNSVRQMQAAIVRYPLPVTPA